MKNKPVWRTLAALLMLPMFVGACQTKPAPTITLAFLGDIMIGRDVAMWHQDGDVDQILSAITPTLQKADLALGNLESPVCVTEDCIQKLESTYADENTQSENALETLNLCAFPGGLRLLQDAGLDILSTENNHTKDCEPYETGSKVQEGVSVNQAPILYLESGHPTHSSHPKRDDPCIFCI